MDVAETTSSDEGTEVAMETVGVVGGLVGAVVGLLVETIGLKDCERISADEVDGRAVVTRTEWMESDNILF